MVNILHLTDFHLNPKTLQDWIDYSKSPMLSKLAEIHNDSKIDFIAYTGDLIDKGGKDYESIQVAFELFEKEVIIPIISHLSLSIDNFLIIPGNHDIERSKDNEREEIGNKGYFVSESNIQSFMQNALKKNDFQGMERIRPYKNFERKLYSEIKGNTYSPSIFGSSFKYKLSNGQSVGICCFNSAWRCYDKNDDGNILIGESQLSKELKFIKNCNIKIALLHHPLDVISPVEKNIISNHITKEFDLLLLGHSHETITSIRTSFVGSLFINLAPSGLNDIRSDSRSFSNGFSFISYNKAIKNISCEYWRYNHNLKEFIPNVDVGENNDGKMSFNFPSKDSQNKSLIIKKLVSNIKDDHCPKMNEHHIGVRANINNSDLVDGFILPPIDDGKGKSDNESSDQIESIHQITQSSTNMFFHGGAESGKTILLYRLVTEYVNEFHFLQKVPVYIDFEEIRNKELITCIKEFLCGKSEEIKYLLKEDKIILFIDNLNYSSQLAKPHIFNRLHSFTKEYDKIRIIATGECELSGLIPNEYIKNSRIPFVNYFINNLTTSEIKKIMKIWIPDNESDNLKISTRLDTLVSNFYSYSLPSTAMSVSLFLWTTEHSDKKPLNNAVMLEIYIEIILEKLNKDNIYRGTFDFTNKLQLLAKIAYEMFAFDGINYSVKYSDFCKVIENYIENEVGFDYDSKVFIDYFFKRKIFTKQKDGRIKFSKSCFFHFFLAKRMEFNSSFKEHVLSKEEYFKFKKEIDYYSGLTRSDKGFLKKIHSHFLDEYSEFDEILNFVDLDKYFTPKRENNLPLAKEIEIGEISKSRPSEEMIENLHNKKLENIKETNIISKKENRSSLENTYIIMSNVLRNSEGIEDLALKKGIYNDLVKHSCTFMLLHRESLITYVLTNNKLPISFPKEINLIHYLENIPYYVQKGVYKCLGTPKLGAAILNKIRLDRKDSRISNIEEFISIGLYADVKGSGFDKEFKTFIRRLKTRIDSNVTSNYSLYKLIDYYYERTRKGSSNEELYLDLLVELKIKAQKLPKRLKDRFVKKMKDSKKNLQKK